MSQFNYLIISLLFPADQWRYKSIGISPEFIWGVLFIFFLWLFYYENLLNFQASTGAIFNLSLLILASTFMVFSIIYNNIGFRPIITVSSFVFYFIAAMIITANYTPFLASQLKKIGYIITPPFLLLILYFYLSERIYFEPIIKGYHSPSHPPGLGRRIESRQLFIDLSHRGE